MGHSLNGAAQRMKGSFADRSINSKTFSSRRRGKRGRLTTSRTSMLAAEPFIFDWGGRRMGGYCSQVQARRSSHNHNQNALQSINRSTPTFQATTVTPKPAESSQTARKQASLDPIQILRLFPFCCVCVCVLVDAPSHPFHHSPAGAGGPLFVCTAFTSSSRPSRGAPSQ